MPNHIEYFNVQTARIGIAVEKYAANNNTFVKSDQFRGFPSFGHPSLTEWIEDTNAICKELSRTNLDYEDFGNTLLKICKNHITKYGRLVDNDLYNYIDEILLVIKALFSMNGSVFPINDGKQEWLALQSLAFQKLTPHIWIHKFGTTPLQATQLVPLSTMSPFQ